ncbi:MAG: hypothetical protein Q8O90_10155 [Elusimicrobiota bacterium]|nr:hypothetical protein [Elusimicrobiota bacterium]
MKKALLFISWLSLVVVPYHAAMADEASSFESQLLEAHKTIMSQAASTHKSVGALPVGTPSSEVDWLTSVAMTVGGSQSGLFYVTEDKMGLMVLADMVSNTFKFYGDLKATAEPLAPTDVAYGYHLKGPDVDVKIVRWEFGGYFISGTYKTRVDKKPISMHILLLSIDNGWKILEKGISLRIQRTMDGAKIDGDINLASGGKREMAILGSCLRAVTYSPR